MELLLLLLLYIFLYAVKIKEKNIPSTTDLHSHIVVQWCFSRLWMENYDTRDICEYECVCVCVCFSFYSSFSCRTLRVEYESGFLVYTNILHICIWNTYCLTIYKWRLIFEFIYCVHVHVERDEECSIKWNGWLWIAPKYYGKYTANNNNNNK